MHVLEKGVMTDLTHFILYVQNAHDFYIQKKNENQQIYIVIHIFFIQEYEASYYLLACLIGKNSTLTIEEFFEETYCCKMYAHYSYYALKSLSFY